MSTTGDAAPGRQDLGVAGTDQVEERSPASTNAERARLQRQARALGNPTRFAIFEHVARVRSPVRVAALVERFGLNHNAVRQHLAKLCEAHLLVEEFAARSGPGRPALQYRLAPEAAGTWGTPSPYEELASLLLQMAAEGLSAREVGRRAGRQAAAAADVDRVTPLDRLVREMDRRGLGPRSVPGSSGVDVVLDSCPLPYAAATHREIVCDIHRGLAEGFLEELGTDLEVSGLRMGTPGVAACTLHLGPSGPDRE